MGPPRRKIPPPLQSVAIYHFYKVFWTMARAISLSKVTSSSSNRYEVLSEGRQQHDISPYKLVLYNPHVAPFDCNHIKWSCIVCQTVPIHYNQMANHIKCKSHKKQCQLHEKLKMPQMKERLPPPFPSSVLPPTFTWSKDQLTSSTRRNNYPSFRPWNKNIINIRSFRSVDVVKEFCKHYELMEVSSLLELAIWKSCCIIRCNESLHTCQVPPTSLTSLETIDDDTDIELKQDVRNTFPHFDIIIPRVVSYL